MHLASRRMLKDFFALADVYPDEKIEDLEPMIDISEDERGVVVTFQEKVLFKSGEVEINRAMFPILDSIAKVLGAVSNEILIMGHSDNVPIHTGRYRSNWDLSLYRALNVHSYFVEKKDLCPKRFGVGGYGDVRPLSPDNTKEAREKNRRVEIILRRA
ncbi:MAG: OmpA family protein [Desulfobacterales bacterium]|nr:OmpA family protein [Desulfobacterales bacterium]